MKLNSIFCFIIFQMTLNVYGITGIPGSLNDLEKYFGKTISKDYKQVSYNEAKNEILILDKSGKLYKRIFNQKNVTELSFINNDQILVLKKNPNGTNQVQIFDLTHNNYLNETLTVDSSVTLDRILVSSDGKLKIERTHTEASATGSVTPKSWDQRMPGQSPRKVIELERKPMNQSNELALPISKEQSGGSK